MVILHHHLPLRLHHMSLPLEGTEEEAQEEQDRIVAGMQVAVTLAALTEVAAVMVAEEVVTKSLSQNNIRLPATLSERVPGRL